jgi:L-seryl-tRNA(Ser) seleniumtransferase
LIGIEAALITTGAAGAITLGTAACVTGGDLAKIQRLPDTTGMRREVILQKSHRNEYETQLRLVGTGLIEVETRAQLEAAINDRTAMLFFMNKADPYGKIRREEWVELGRKHGIPTFLDAAADTPPREHLASYARMGFDLVAFSGGKSLRGPQSTGLLVGRKDLIAAARHNASPYDGTVGRAMKVGKEEVAGLVNAVERFLTTDHAAEFRQFESRIRKMDEALVGMDGVHTELWVPEIANHVPHLMVTWDPARLPFSSATVYQRLLDGEPRVAVRERAPHGVIVSPLMLHPDEDETIVRQLRRVLSGS